MKKKSIPVKQLVAYLNQQIIRVEGPIESIYIDNIPDINHVIESSLDWINPSKSNKQELAELSAAKVLIVDESIVYTNALKDKGKTIIVVKKPRVTMAEIAEHFFVEKKEPCINPSAMINKEAFIDSTAHISAGCVIGKAKIGANTVLMPNVVVYDDVIIGDNCLIQAGAIIGTDGLGCSRDDTGKLTKFPHLGGVIIGNNVEIGANSQIAKGSLSDTIIEDGCKLNGLCFIAHNCHLEENVWITGNTMLCGSVYVKRNTTIFSSVIVRDQRKIGEGAMIGMGAVVTKDVPDNETWIGNPAHKLENRTRI